MMTKKFGTIVKICVCVLFVMSLCLIPSCKKSPEEPAGEGPSQQSVTTTESETPAPSTIDAVPEETEKPAEVVAETETQSCPSRCS